MHYAIVVWTRVNTVMTMHHVIAVWTRVNTVKTMHHAVVVWTRVNTVMTLQKNGPAGRKRLDRTSKRTRQKNKRLQSGIKWQPCDSRHGGDIRHPRPPLRDLLSVLTHHILCVLFIMCVNFINTQYVFIHSSLCVLTQFNVYLFNLLCVPIHHLLCVSICCLQIVLTHHLFYLSIHCLLIVVTHHLLCVSIYCLPCV